MADARAATVPLVDEAKATGKVAKIFADIKNAEECRLDLTTSGLYSRRTLPEDLEQGGACEPNNRNKPSYPVARNY
jgi:hypothetical protein